MFLSEGIVFLYAMGMMALSLDWWQRSWKRLTKYSLLTIVGFILSPLSWWNDLLVNIPLAYLFAVPFGWADEQLFLLAFVLGYWLTNVLGFVLMHKGMIHLAHEEKKQLNIKQDVEWAMAYTLLIVFLVWRGWLPIPDMLLIS